jgi:hypothetical protein
MVGVWIEPVMAAVIIALLMNGSSFIRGFYLPKSRFISSLKIPSALLLS